MRCIIVDDDEMSRTGLAYLCRKHPSLELLNSYSDAVSAIESIKHTIPDLILLDIEMPGGSGFDVLDALVVTPLVIVVSSKEIYAFDAYQYEVNDYLRKPVSQERFYRAIDKVQSTASQKKEEIGKKSVFIRSDGKHIQILFSDIQFIQKIGDYVKFHTDKGSFLSHTTLKKLLELMPTKDFVKVHRSYVVNLLKIVDIQEYSLVVAEHVVPISRGLKADLMERINTLQ